MIDGVIIVKSRLVTKRTHAKLMRELNIEVMKNHLRDTIPKHFEDIPETKPGGDYNYDARSEATNRRKRKRWGHARPNVDSGLLKRAVIGRARVTGTQHRSRLIMSGTPRHRLSDKQRLEIEKVPGNERVALARWMEKQYAKRVDRWEYLAQRSRKA